MTSNSESEPTRGEPLTVEQRRKLSNALNAIADLAAISKKAASSRPDTNTDVLVLNLGHIRTLIEARSWLARLTASAPASGNRRVVNGVCLSCGRLLEAAHPAAPTEGGDRV